MPRSLASFLVVCAVLLGIAAAVDLGLTAGAERQAAERLSAELGAPATVDLRGWPVTLRLLTGEVPEVVAEASSVPVPERAASLSRLTVTLTGVRLRLGDLRAPEALPVRARTGRFTATVTADDLLELAGRPPIVQALELRPGVVRLVLLGGVTVEGTATARDGVLVLTPAQPVLGIAELPVPLGELPAGATVDRVEVGDGELLLEGSVQDLLLTPAG